MMAGPSLTNQSRSTNPQKHLSDVKRDYACVNSDQSSHHAQHHLICLRLVHIRTDLLHCRLPPGFHHFMRSLLIQQTDAAQNSQYIDSLPSRAVHSVRFFCALSDPSGYLTFSSSGARPVMLRRVSALPVHSSDPSARTP